MRNYLSIIGIFLMLVLLGCEEDINLTLPAAKEIMVVEGHIDINGPAIVMLSRSNPVFASNSPTAISNSFIHGATIAVEADNQKYILQEFTGSQLSPELREIIAEQFSLNLSQLTANALPVLYFYINTTIKGQPGKNYKLQITAANQVLTAITSIPNFRPVDSLWTVPHPDINNDSLVTLWYKYRDPDTLGNCVRYFTKRNRETFYSGFLNSVFIDEFVNGKFIIFPLERGQSKSSKIQNDKTYSYFTKGDTITLKWSSIDLAHYQFWNTLEAERSSNGNPVASPVLIQGNIKGGLGVWGGYGSTYYKLIVPK